MLALKGMPRANGSGHFLPLQPKNHFFSRFIQSARERLPAIQKLFMHTHNSTAGNSRKACWLWLVPIGTQEQLL
jgi:hypothetical protein